MMIRYDLPCNGIESGRWRENAASESLPKNNRISTHTSLTSESAGPCIPSQSLLQALLSRNRVKSRSARMRRDICTTRGGKEKRMEYVIVRNDKKDRRLLLFPDRSRMWCGMDEARIHTCAHRCTNLGRRTLRRPRGDRRAGRLVARRSSTRHRGRRRRDRRLPGARRWASVRISSDAPARAPRFV